MDLLAQGFVYLVAAVVSVPIANKLGLGSVLGYLIAGVAIGPVLGVVGSETTDVRHFAEFGVVMMLFLVGLELQPSVLWRMRRNSWGSAFSRWRSRWPSSSQLRRRSDFRGRRASRSA